jgi:hypothetical protein
MSEFADRFTWIILVAGFRHAVMQWEQKEHCHGRSQ